MACSACRTRASSLLRSSRERIKPALSRASSNMTVSPRTEQTQVMRKMSQSFSWEREATAAAPLTISPVGTKGMAEPKSTHTASNRWPRS